MSWGSVSFSRLARLQCCPPRGPPLFSLAPFSGTPAARLRRDPRACLRAVGRRPPRFSRKA